MNSKYSMRVYQIKGIIVDDDSIISSYTFPTQAYSVYESKMM
jgi:hypothetical protein